MTDNLLLMKLESKAKKDKDRHIKGVGRAHYTQVPRGPVYNETRRNRTEEWQFNMLWTPLKLPMEKRKKHNKRSTMVRTHQRYHNLIIYLLV